VFPWPIPVAWLTHQLHEARLSVGAEGEEHQVNATAKVETNEEQPGNLFICLRDSLVVIMAETHFLGLDNFELCARLLNREPFLAKSLPPLETARRRSKLVNRHSGQKYCKQQKHVQEKIEHWLKRGH